MRTKYFLVTFRHQNTTCTRVIEATTRDNAMGSVCGFVYGCDEINEKLAKVLVNLQ